MSYFVRPGFTEQLLLERQRSGGYMFDHELRALRIWREANSRESQRYWEDAERKQQRTEGLSK